MQAGSLFIPSFPAWAFLRSEGTGPPLAVLSSGRVVAVCRAGRRSGIETGMSGERAKSLCPDVRLRIRSADLEEAAWEDVIQSVNGVTPFIEASSPPFLYFKPDDLPATRALTEALSVHGGVAPNRPSAQLAALRAAPGNTLVLSPQNLNGFLDRFAVERLTEIGFEEDSVELLRHFGYATLGAAKQLSLRHLKAQFGDDGERLFGMLHPEHEPPVPLFREPPVIRQDYEFDDACREPGEILPVLEHLVARATEALKPQYCQRLRLAATGCRNRMNTMASHILPEPIGSLSSLLRASVRLLHAMLSPDLEMESLTLELGALRHVKSTQIPLFRERPSVFCAVRAVHRRFPEMVRRAVVQPYVLFSEDEMRFDPFPEEGPPRRGRKRSR
jgi:nucleotidyltransferase/DNA polymerase involved in DNA repair